MRVLDLFSAAAGGWSLGMHRAGFTTMAACEAVEWRRILYAENNPGVRLYDDVRTLTAERLLGDFGYLPDFIAGSPPCQDISSANTKGRGVEGERSGLYFEAVRLVGECRPRWFAFENSANLRTRGADPVLAALEALDYACWPLVVRAGDIGANHERPRSWLIGCDLEQVAYPYRHGEHAQSLDGEMGKLSGLAGNRGNEAANAHGDAVRFAELPGRPEPQAPVAEHVVGGETPNTDCQLPDERPEQSGSEGEGRHIPSHGAADRNIGGTDGTRQISGGHGGLGTSRNTPDPDQAGQADGCMVSGLRQAEVADDGRRAGWSDDGSRAGQMGLCPPDRGNADGSGSLWSLDDLARHLQLDDGLSARLAGTRIGIGGPKGTAAASLIVEAFGDAVVPQIPEAIGNAILRTEAALAAIHQRKAA
ncbi:hypothetical protein BSL82_00595 [Tardibacter chloracetimidivorans]|uniref:Uncharacterized protein n=1 Tax=Tardibacter chloracetimidivorans TaxID=1921510 RepID=A0A1L3ZZ28_9SPHN|nr:hypothetical protein BSL82_00595 [Tardibacter chloracetimidivorans]